VVVTKGGQILEVRRGALTSCYLQTPKQWGSEAEWRASLPSSIEIMDTSAQPKLSPHLKKLCDAIRTIGKKRLMNSLHIGTSSAASIMRLELWRLQRRIDIVEKAFLKPSTEVIESMCRLKQMLPSASNVRTYLPGSKPSAYFIPPGSNTLTPIYINARANLMKYRDEVDVLHDVPENINTFWISLQTGHLKQVTI